MARLTDVERKALGLPFGKFFGWACTFSGFSVFGIWLIALSSRRWEVFPLQLDDLIFLICGVVGLVIGRLWNRMIDRGQRAYLDRLRSEGRLPTVEGRLADVERAALGFPVAQVFAWGVCLAGFGAYAGFALLTFQRGPPIEPLSSDELALFIAGPLLMTAGLVVGRISKRRRLAQLARLKREGRLPGQEIR